MRRSDVVLRRAILALLLAVATSVSVGDDVGTAPDVRRGSRTIAVDLPEPFSPALLHVPRTQAAGVAIVLHAGGGPSLDRLLDTLAASTLVVPVDGSTADVRTSSCDTLIDALALASRQAQREAGLTVYRPPVLVGLDAAAPLARGLLLASEPDVFKSGIGEAGPATGVAGQAPCGPAAAVVDGRRWRDVPASNLPVEAAALLERPAERPTTGHAPLDRWLTHFALPMTAEWVARPRAVTVLMSDARVLRQPHPRLAARLAEAGVSVLTIDALQYFWQRRSPRDVAFELRRLLGALESLSVPVLVGGLGSGAETMAVAVRHMEDRPVDGLVLIAPGPSAFFEVDPPLPALVPLIRADWSTAEAVEMLAVPTLCASSGDARAGHVCEQLARFPYVRVAHGRPAAASRDEDAELAALIVDLARRAGSRHDDTTAPAQPRKPST